MLAVQQCLRLPTQLAARAAAWLQCHPCQHRVHGGSHANAGNLARQGCPADVEVWLVVSVSAQVYDGILTARQGLEWHCSCGGQVGKLRIYAQIRGAESAPQTLLLCVPVKPRLQCKKLQLQSFQLSYKKAVTIGILAVHLDVHPEIAAALQLHPAQVHLQTLLHL